MTPFFVLIAATALFRIVAFIGVWRFLKISECMRWGLAVMFLFTGVTHFTSMRHDYLRMIPFDGLKSIETVYLTGLLEIAGAIGLLFEKPKRLAATSLILFLIAVLPANIYASVNDIPFRENPPTNLYVRVGIQIVYVLFLMYVWKCNRRK